MYKLIASDIDGTLFNSNREVSGKTIETVRRAVEQGAVFCISSGRPIQIVDKFVKFFELPDMPFILYNGAMVVTGEAHDVLLHSTLQPDVAKYLINAGNKLQTTIIVWANNKLYVNEINERSLKYSRLQNITPVVIDDIDKIAGYGVTKVLWFDALERMPELGRFLDGCSCHEKINYFTSNPLFMEIVDKSCSKALALEQLAKHYGISRNEIMAIGDGYNDLPMLEYAGLSVAMANAPEEIRQKCDVVTLSNDEDGVAAAIEKYVISNSR